tara:strand:- start:8 stop:469 length:462 start_codon:yes stop_codon:yes gene_type:complete
MNLSEMAKPMEIAVDDLIEEIKVNYSKWQNIINKKTGDSSDKYDYAKEACTRFNEGIRVEVGSKYTKIFTGSSIWGFIVNENDSVKCIKSGCYFSRGDLLKPASYKAPTRNFARGNIRLGKNYSRYNDLAEIVEKDNSVRAYPNYQASWTSAS